MIWNSFVAVLRKEFKHIFRDRGTLVLFFMLPVMQLALFGFLDQNVRDLPTVANGLGVSILSTPKGVMSDSRARTENVGGEILCSVF